MPWGVLQLMLECRHYMRAGTLVLGACLLFVVWPAGNASVSSGASEIVPGKFVDVTSALGVHFQNRSSHTSKKYLIETMGAGCG